MDRVDMQTVTDEREQLSFHPPPSTLHHLRGLRVLLVAEGSGGHLIPALEVARRLGLDGASVSVLYAQRAQLAGLLAELLSEAQAAGARLHPIQLPARSLWQAARVWRLARALLRAQGPGVVVGFGGWISVPVVLAARARRIPVLLHEQNVRLGRANRWLWKWADARARSFERSQDELEDTASVVTGLPIRQAIGTVSRSEAARALGLDPAAPTILIVGGSQGATVINRLMGELVNQLPDTERRAWQLVHLTGPTGCPEARAAYAQARIRSWVASHLGRMEWAYAMADVAVARAGASTIAELARCRIPAIVIPYPYAAGHQRENARLLESVGAGLWIEEAEATPAQVLERLRRLLADPIRRERMSAQMARLFIPDAAERLVSMVARLATADALRRAPLSRGLLRAMVSEGTESNHAQR